MYRSDIRPPLIPPWWCILPPPVRVLRGLYWQGAPVAQIQLKEPLDPSSGYMDALMWFRAPPRAQRRAGIMPRRVEQGRTKHTVCSAQEQCASVVCERAAPLYLYRRGSKASVARAVSAPRTLRHSGRARDAKPQSHKVFTARRSQSGLGERKWQAAKALLKQAPPKLAQALRSS